MEWLPLLFSGVSNLVGGWMNQNAADKSTQAMTDAINKGIAFDKDTLNKVIDLNKTTTNQIGNNLAPWIMAGKNALTAYKGELGLSTAAKNGTFVSGFEATPAYQFEVAEGEKAAVNNLRALGMGGSGAALKALTEFRQGKARSAYDDYLARLSGMSTEGLNASTNLGNAMLTGTNNVTDATINTGRNVTDNLVSLGVAQGSGQVAGTNSWLGALKGFSGDLGKTLGGYSGGWGKYLGAGA